MKVRRNAGLLERSFRARSHIQRARSGVILALVELTPFGGVEEWIGHEFEHVLEQLDGLRLEEMADGRGNVWRSSDNMFETERAIRAGRAVAGEVRRSRDRQDKLVE